MKVVADSSTLIILARIHRFGLLRELYGIPVSILPAHSGNFGTAATRLAACIEARLTRAGSGSTQLRTVPRSTARLGRHVTRCVSERCHQLSHSDYQEPALLAKSQPSLVL